MIQPNEPSRRTFLKTAAAGGLACLGAAVGTRSTAGAAELTAAKADVPFTLGMASYTFRKFDLDQTLVMTSKLGLTAICLKSFHLPLDASAEEIKVAVQKVKDAGIVLYGGGVIGMKSDEQVNKAFEYAKQAGMSKIIAAPTAEMLGAIDRKVREYDIEVCIHNHGPGDKHFPTPAEAYAAIKDLDRRVGICHDVGHTIRYGQDAIDQTEKYSDRILDFHMKDVTEATKAGHATPCGRGVIDIPGLIRCLLKIGYSGYVSFEYEASPDDPMTGLIESVGYVRRVIDEVA